MTAPDELVLRRPTDRGKRPELLKGNGRLHWTLELVAYSCGKIRPVLEKLEHVTEGLRVSLNSVKTDSDPHASLAA